jgi:hypothetical protein
MGWIHSGPRRPCPCCGRTSDDKCRWALGTISCWWGDRHSPPSGLQPGDVLTLAEGGRWFVARLAGGYGNNSLILHPHRELERPLRQAAKRRLACQQQAAVQEAEEAVKSLRSSMHRCLAALDPEHGTLDEFLVDLQTCRCTWQQVMTTRDLLTTTRRWSGKPVLPRSALDIWIKQIAHQLKDLEYFDQHLLGTPQQLDIEELAAAAEADHIHHDRREAAA